MKLLAIVALVVTMNSVATAQQGGMRRRSEASKIESRRRNNQIIALVGEARRLMVLGQDPTRSERLLLEAEEVDKTLGSIQETLASLYEGQGRFVEACNTYRKLIHLPAGQSSTISEMPMHLMRYALLCRKVGRLGEERAILAKIPGADLFAKTVRAAEQADEIAQYDLSLQFWEEAARLRPSDLTLVPKLAEAREYYKFVVAEAVAKAKLGPAVIKP